MKSAGEIFTENRPLFSRDEKPSAILDCIKQIQADARIAGRIEGLREAVGKIKDNTGSGCGTDCDRCHQNRYWIRTLESAASELEKGQP